MNIRSIFAGILIGIGAIAQSAVVNVPELSLFGTPYTRSEIYNYTITELNPDNPADMLQLLAPASDSLAPGSGLQADTSVTEIVTSPLPGYYFRPVVFSSFQFLDTIRVQTPLSETEKELDPQTFGWLMTDFYHNDLIRHARQAMVVRTPYLVVYDEASLPEPPKKFEAKVDPTTAKIVIAEIIPEKAPEQKLEAQFYKRHWLKTFNGSVQFSQAYISPNWYQGGKSNLNGILNLFYNVKLNQAFHPNLMFETSMQYKLGVNNAPDDTIHSYNITEDLFQINSKFGLKAAKRWYYSINAQFKTQLLNNYRVNTDDLTAAFLSPGELNVGVGMTYNYENPRKTVNFSAVISPLSYNMKMCTNSRLNETAFGIEEGKKTVSQYGSSAELTFKAKLAWNIEYFSRLFMFTNYEYVQGDWENTLTFNFNRFLSTKVFAHLRYQSDTPRLEDTKWQKWQLKEIISIGFSYKFSRS